MRRHSTDLRQDELCTSPLSLANKQNCLRLQQTCSAPHATLDRYEAGGLTVLDSLPGEEIKAGGGTFRAFWRRAKQPAASRMAERSSRPRSGLDMRKQESARRAMVLLG